LPTPSRKKVVTGGVDCCILSRVVFGAVGMGRHLWPVFVLVFICPALCHGAEPTFSEAIGLLSQERTYAEGGVALVKQYVPNDIEARRLYADAKGAFDGLIEQLLADLAQNRDPSLSGAFRERLDAAVVKRVAFNQRVEAVLKANVPEGAKPAILEALAEALAKAPTELIKQLFDGGMAIWKEWHGVSTERRKQITTRIEAQRWKPFSEIGPAL
jgi:hypothetical protein